MSELNQWELSIVDRLRYGLQHNQSVTLGSDEVHIPMNAIIERGNRRAQPENEPHTNDALTRDELYHLDGEPLYVMDGEGHECYCVVNTKNEDCIDNEAGAWCFEFYDMTGDGKYGLHKIGWRAYRTKPERGE